MFKCSVSNSNLNVFPGDSDDETLDEEPVLETAMIKHNGGTNRIRVCGSFVLFCFNIRTPGVPFLLILFQRTYVLGLILKLDQILMPVHVDRVKGFLVDVWDYL